MNRIGIIGAAGVAATNRLCTLIEEEVTRRGAFRDAHHPDMVVVQCTQVPSRSLFLEGRGESFIPDYIEVGKKLKDFGCREIVMCCNTAHYALDGLKEEVGIPFVDVLGLVAKEVHKLGSKHSGIICGNGCRKFFLYDKAFAKYAPETEVVYPSDEMQNIVTEGICGAKSKLRFENFLSVSNHPRNCFISVCKTLEEQNVDAIVGGCTDINNVFDGEIEWNGVKYIDSLKVIVRYIVNNYSNI